MTHRIYVIEKFLPPRLNQALTGAPAPKVAYWPVESYGDRKACDREVARRNSRSKVWQYRRRPQSLKLFGLPGGN